MSQLKEREQKILSYMKEEIRTKGYPPTVREICAALGIKSTSTAHKDIESLVKQGYLVKDPSKPRALMVVDPVSGQRDKFHAAGTRRKHDRSRHNGWGSDTGTAVRNRQQRRDSRCHD